MGLQQFWFVIVAVLFLGFFVLEGFDFGVGMVMAWLGRIGKTDPESHRRAVLNTIGPVWDGNEVWLITAGGAMFAAFPHWYATVFSTLYLPLLVILLVDDRAHRGHRMAGQDRRSEVAQAGATSGSRPGRGSRRSCGAWRSRFWSRAFRSGRTRMSSGCRSPTC